MSTDPPQKSSFPKRGCCLLVLLTPVAAIVAIIGMMMTAQRTIPFSEGQSEREAVVAMVQSGALPLEDKREGEFEGTMLTLGTVNLPEEYAQAAKNRTASVLITDGNVEISFLNHTSLFGDNPTYYVYNADLDLAQQSEYSPADFGQCADGAPFAAEKKAPDWYFVACGY